MAEFWTDYVWPLIIMLAESVLMLVVLLIAVAYVLLADRKIWAAVQIRRGPNVVGPWGLFQSFGRLLGASGLAAVTFNHRFFGWDKAPEALVTTIAVALSLSTQQSRRWSGLQMIRLSSTSSTDTRFL